MFVIAGNVTVVVPPSESPTAIVINCETVEWEEPNILPTFTDSIRVVNTPYIHVYNIISNTTQLVTVELSAQQAAHCLVSAYSQQQVLEVYTVSEGERGQLYRRPMRGGGYVVKVCYMLCKVNAFQLKQYRAHFII